LRKAPVSKGERREKKNIGRQEYIVDDAERGRRAQAPSLWGKFRLTFLI